MQEPYQPILRPTQPDPALEGVVRAGSPWSNRGSGAARPAGGLDPLAVSPIQEALVPCSSLLLSSLRSDPAGGFAATGVVPPGCAPASASLPDGWVAGRVRISASVAARLERRAGFPLDRTPAGGVAVGVVVEPAGLTLACLGFHWVAKRPA